MDGTVGRVARAVGEGTNAGCSRSKSWVREAEKIQEGEKLPERTWEGVALMSYAEPLHQDGRTHQSSLSETRREERDEASCPQTCTVCRNQLPCASSGVLVTKHPEGGKQPSLHPFPEFCGSDEPWLRRLS